MKFFYKQNNGETYEARETPLKTSENCIEITEEEYKSAVAEIYAKIEKEFLEEAQAEQSYIEQLEAENAALLYQLLTGEELTDV